ncbi:MAG: MGMT family protein [Aestuariivita sp.]|nr:MGMT family protein [Aestuariivita sp.]
MSHFLTDTTVDQRRNWIRRAVRSLPVGKVTNYGAIAKVVYGQHSEQIHGANRWYFFTQPTSAALKGLANQDSETFPWWRVVSKDLRPPAHLLRKAEEKLRSEDKIKLCNKHVPRTYYLCYEELKKEPAIKQIMREIETYIYGLPS